MIAKTASILGPVLVFLHGLVHLIGVGVYWQLAEIEGLAYKTALLNGSWNLGETGVRAFGGIWLVNAIGFAVAAIGLTTHRSWWRPVLLSSASISLLITGLDWTEAYAGLVINVAILGTLWLTWGERQLATA